MNPTISKLASENPLLLVVIILSTVWNIFWKSVALWRAARNEQRNWFVAFIVLFPINLFGIIELIYLFKFAKKKLTLNEIKGWFGQS